MVNILSHYVLPKAALTRFAGFMANIQVPFIKNHLIEHFVEKYEVDLSEAQEENPRAYACFNDFFIRQLKPSARPIQKADLILPVDGCVSEIGRITEGQLIQAKGHRYTVHELLATDQAMSEQFHAGQFATLYLSPKDYHRVHMPIDATLLKMIYVPGRLFSVQPKTVNAIPRLFARNERVVTFFETSIGLMAMVLVGATIVGAIGTTWHGDVVRSSQIQVFDYTAHSPIRLKQAEEMGYFKLGSTAIVLFANGDQMAWDSDLKPGCCTRLGRRFGAVV